MRKRISARMRVITDLTKRKRPVISRLHVVKSLGLPDGTVSAAFAYLKKAGLLMRVGDNRYARTKLFGTLTPEQMLVKMREQQQAVKAKRTGKIAKRAARVKQPSDAILPITAQMDDLVGLIADGRRYREAKPLLQKLFSIIE